MIGISDRLLNSLWLGPSLWAAFFISDYYLTLLCARLYQSRVRQKLVFEGSFELTPFYQKDIDSLRNVSPRFLLMLCLVVTLLVTTGFLARASEITDVYSFLLGVLILLQVSIHHRHLKSLILFRAMASTEAVRGRIEYSRRVILQQSATELFCFAGIYAFVFLFTASLFVLGGVVSCSLTGVKHLQLARKQSPDSRLAKPAAQA